MSLCPCCGRAMREFKQARFPETLPPYVLADCQNPACVLYLVTLTKGQHALLTPEQIARYAKSKEGNE